MQDHRDRAGSYGGRTIRPSNPDAKFSDSGILRPGLARYLGTRTGKCECESQRQMDVRGWIPRLMVNNQGNAPTFIGGINIFGNAPIIDRFENTVSDIDVKVRVKLSDRRIKTTRLPSTG